MATSFQVPSNDGSTAKRFTQLRAMHVMACIVIVIFGIQKGFLKNTIDWNSICMYVLPSLGILYISIFQASQLQIKTNNSLFRILESCLSFSAAMYFLQTHKIAITIFFMFLCVVLLMLYWYENYYFHKQYITITDTYIEIPSTFRLIKYTWAEIESTIIHTNVITLFLKNKEQKQVGIKIDSLLQQQMSYFCDTKCTLK